MIEVEHLTKQYGSLTAVDDLSFTVRPGVVTGLLGPNGAGKTTTMSIVLGLQAPTSGRTLVAGRAYRDIDRPLHEVGALLDAAAVHSGRTARAHLTWVAQSNGIATRRVDEVLGIVGLDSVAGKRLRGYSLGMKQRLGIAQALLGNAPVLIFDEPVNGLDAEGIGWITAVPHAAPRRLRQPGTGPRAVAAANLDESRLLAATRADVLSQR